MSDSYAIRQSVSDGKDTGGATAEEELLWRRAEHCPIPLSEKIAHAFFGTTVLLFYFFGSNETSPVIVAILWFIAFSASCYRRQQAQIDALRQLLRQRTARR